MNQDRKDSMSSHDPVGRFLLEALRHRRDYVFRCVLGLIVTLLLCPSMLIFLPGAYSSPWFESHPYAAIALYLASPGMFMLVPVILYKFAPGISRKFPVALLCWFGVSILITAVIGWFQLLSR